VGDDEDQQQQEHQPQNAGRSMNEASSKIALLFAQVKVLMNQVC